MPGSTAIPAPARSDRVVDAAICVRDDSLKWPPSAPISASSQPLSVFAACHPRDPGVSPRFAPNASGPNPRRRAVALAVAALVGLVALAPHASAATSVLTPSPSTWDSGNTDIHVGGPTQTFTHTNNTPGTVNVAGVAILGADPSEFQMDSDGCLGCHAVDVWGM